MKKMITKIVSGGQTGADRAALDFAVENNIPHGYLHISLLLFSLDMNQRQTQMPTVGFAFKLSLFTDGRFAAAAFA